MISHPARMLHERIEAQARRVPDRAAVVCGDGVLTYGALSRQSALLAHALRARGIGAEQRVGLWLERSMDWIWALLGVLESGAAYVPIDAAWPAARVHALVRDGGLSALVTRRRLIE